MGTKSKRQSVKSSRWVTRIVLLIILAVILAAGLFFESEINTLLKLKNVKEVPYDGIKTDVVLGGGAENLKSLYTHFVDVGQGDSCIIELPDEKLMIIDGGTDKDKNKLLTYIDENIRRNGEKITYFDYAILTHADEDHCGGLDDVLSLYPAKVFYRPNEMASYEKYVDPGVKDLLAGYGSQSTAAYKKAIDSGYNADKINGIETTVLVSDANNDNTSLIEPELGENDSNYYSINFYAPTMPSYKDRNNYSPILILEYQGYKMCLAGDAEKQAEADFVNKIGTGGKYNVFDENYSVDILKLSHHGSKTSSSEAYLEALTSEKNVKDVKVVISCGLDNKYKHPSIETLDRLKKMGFREENILRTDKNGNLAFSIKGEVKENIPVYSLYFGGSLAREYSATLSIGIVEVTYREIALSLFIFVAGIVIIQPLVSSAKRKAKKAKRKYTRG